MSRTRPRLEEDRRALAAAYYPRALRIVRPFVNRYPDLADEFESLAGWLCCVAAARWDGRHQFGTTLEAYLRPAPLMVLRARRRSGWQSACDLAETPMGVDLDLEPPSDPRLGRLDAALDRLTPIQQRTVRALFWEGLTPTQVARERGVTNQTGHEAARSALRQLRTSLEST